MKNNQHLINNVGTNLKKHREKKGLTRTQLAHELGLTLQAVSQYEKCTRLPSDKILNKIADIFEITIDELIGITQDISPFLPQNLVLSKDDESILMQQHIELTKQEKLLAQNIQFTELQQKYIDILKEKASIEIQIEYNKRLSSLTEYVKNRDTLEKIKKLLDLEDNLT